MNKKTRWIVIGLICAVGAGIVLYPTLSKNQDTLEEIPVKGKRKEKKPLNVKATIIKAQKLTDEIKPSGNLIPDEEVALSFETSGKIVSINFTEGSAVHKGDLLAKVNDKPLQAQLKKLEAQYKLAQDRVYRQNALLEKDAVSKEAYQQATTDFATLKADIELIKANIAQTELRAPFDGIIGLRQVSEGAYAAPNTPIALLTKISPLKIDFAVPERYASQIKKGTRLTFTIDGHLQEYAATVYATESQVNSTTHTLSVRALYPNTRNELLPGRFAGIRLKLHEIPNAIAIPSEAIVPEMGVDKVYLYKSRKAMPVEVRTGIRTASSVQITQGLTPGDTIITSGTLQLRTGLDVILENIN